MLQTDNSKTQSLTQRHFVLLVMALVYGFLCFSQSIALAAPASKTTLPAWYADTAWTTEEWTGDSTPYRQIALKVDSLINAGEKPSALLNKYQKQAQQHPDDPQRQFAWGYVAYHIASARQTPDLVGYNLLNGPRQSLVHAPSPPVYEYDRLRFQVYGSELGNKLVPLGERLLQRDPSDAKVKTKLAYILAGSRNPAEQQQALVYAQEIAKADPTNLAIYLVPAITYASRWNHSHDKTDADKATVAYQQWLQYAPPDDAFRQNVKIILRLLSGK